MKKFWNKSKILNILKELLTIILVLTVKISILNLLAKT